MKNLRRFFLIFFATAFCGCAGVIYDPIYPPREVYVPSVDWSRAPLEVIRRSARLDLELQRARERYEAARRAQQEQARAAAEHDFYNQLPRGTHAPSSLCGEAYEAYQERFNSLVREYRFLLEQEAKKRGELDFYRRHKSPWR